MTVLFIFLALLCVSLYYFFTSKKQSKDTVTCFTGGLGSGKTFMAVKTALSWVKMQNLIYLLSFIPLVRFFIGKRSKAYLYSNFPIIVGRRFIFFGKPKYSRVLKREHILMTEILPQGCCVCIDEIGQFASQYDYDNPYVMEYLQEFIRFYRHYLGGKLILTDQCSANIVVCLRRRISIIYCLSNFRRVLCILPFYLTDVQEFSLSEEQIQSVNVLDRETSKERFFGFLQYKWISRHLKLFKYDSRCYSIMYMAEKNKTNAPLKWEKLKTNYLIDIPCTGQERKEYNKYGALSLNLPKADDKDKYLKL